MVRKQEAKVDKVFWKADLKIKVPKESLIVLLLFLIYINNIDTPSLCIFVGHHKVFYQFENINFFG